MYTAIEACRSCGSDDLETVLDLGVHALADGLVREADAEEPTFPLTVAVCAACGLMQIREDVDPDILFCRDYPYFSSFIDSLLRHSKANVDELCLTRNLGPEHLVVELASNDGYLLQYYAQRGIPVLGIDPADGPAAAAVEKGVPTLNTFFTLELARKLRDEGRLADVIHANNVLAHVPDLNGFVEGIATLLSERGVAVIECPHVLELIRHCEFDTIYHQHHCYMSVTALRPLFARHGLTLNDVRRLDIHGGSLRLFVSRQPGESEAVREALAEEAAEKLDTPEGYRSFGRRVDELRTKLSALLEKLKGEGATIAAYGAAAKGATLINTVGIGPDLVDFVADRNTHKHGRFMPGLHIPIVPAERLAIDRPDYTLLLAWNFAEEILSQQEEYLAAGGRFIVPVPEPRIIEPEERA